MDLFKAHTHWMGDCCYKDGKESFHWIKCHKYNRNLLIRNQFNNRLDAKIKSCCLNSNRCRSGNCQIFNRPGSICYQQYSIVSFVNAKWNILISYKKYTSEKYNHRFILKSSTWHKDSFKVSRSSVILHIRIFNEYKKKNIITINLINILLSITLWTIFETVNR